MKKCIQLLLCCFLFLHGNAQKKVSLYFLTELNETINDETLPNNPWAIGAGFQAFVQTKTKFKPSAEVTYDLYLENDKVLRLNTNGSIQQGIDGGMLNFFIGSTFQATNNFYVSLLLGPSFINSTTLFGIKPSLGLYFSQSKKVMAKVSYLNIFNRGSKNENFTSMSIAVGFKLF